MDRCTNTFADFSRRGEAAETARKRLSLVVISSVARAVFARLDAHYRVLFADGTENWLSLVRIYRPALVIVDTSAQESDFTCQLRNKLCAGGIAVLAIISREALQAGKCSRCRQWDDFIQSPVDERELLLRVQMLLAHRVYLRERYVNSPPAMPIESAQENFLGRIKSAVEKNLENPLFGVAGLAREAGVSQPQLYRKMIALTGLSPNGYIRHIRLSYAAQLLSAGAGNISEVAGRVGFSSQSYFTKCFKAIHKQSPKRWSGMPAVLNPATGLGTSSTTGGRVGFS